MTYRPPLLSEGSWQQNNQVLPSHNLLCLVQLLAVLITVHNFTRSQECQKPWSIRLLPQTTPGPCSTGCFPMLTSFPQICIHPLNFFKASVRKGFSGATLAGLSRYFRVILWTVLVSMDTDSLFGICIFSSRLIRYEYEPAQWHLLLFSPTSSLGPCLSFWLESHFLDFASSFQWASWLSQCLKFWNSFSMYLSPSQWLPRFDNPK